MYDRRQSTESQYNRLIRVSWFINLNRYISATSNKMKHINIYSIELRLTFANVWDHSPPDRGHWLLHYMGDLRHYSQNPYLAKAKLVNGIFGIPFQSASHKIAPMFSTNNIISSGKNCSHQGLHTFMSGKTKNEYKSGVLHYWITRHATIPFQDMCHQNFWY